MTGATTGRIYRLRLDKSAFIVEFERGTSLLGSEAPQVNVDILEKGPAEDRLVERAIYTQSVVAEMNPELIARSRDHSTETKSCLVVPILRGGSCLGVLNLESSLASHFTDKDRESAETASAVTLSLFEKRSSLELFNAVQKPIDFYQPLDKFLDELLLVIADASGMPYIALREADVEGHRLHCIALYGFGPDPNKALWDLDPVSDYPTFVRALHNRQPAVEPSLDRDELSNLRARPELQGIRSFVVAPVLVGKEVFGTLSFAAPCVFDYSPLEVAGFESIANAIGVAITNHRNAQKVQAVFAEDAKLSVSITALEVAQAARHEARASVDDCQELLATLSQLIKRSKEDPERIQDKMSQLSTKLNDINKAIDTIRDVSRQPARVEQDVPLKDVLRQAVGLVGGKLAVQRIDCRIGGADVTLTAYPELLRHVFLHLLLNSIDAFSERAAKRDRQITMTVDTKPDDPKNVTIRYVDNAGGIDLARLKTPSGVDGLKKGKEVVFDPGVTSKVTGSGYGLYLARRIMAQHNGSIDLIDHRNSTVFDVVLPRRAGH